IRIQPLAEARRKIAREAPAAEPLAASRTLESRNSLTCPHGTAAYPLHPAQSTLRFVRGRICVAPAAWRLAPAIGSPGTTTVPASAPASARRLRLRFRQACSSRNCTTAPSQRQRVSERDSIVTA